MKRININAYGWLACFFIVQGCTHAFSPIQNSILTETACPINSSKEKEEELALEEYTWKANDRYTVTIKQGIGKQLKAKLALTGYEQSGCYQDIPVKVAPKVDLKTFANYIESIQQRRTYIQWNENNKPVQIGIMDQGGLQGGILTDNNDDEWPEDCFCPITLELLEKPVILPDGYSFSKETIEKLTAGSNTIKSPITRQLFPKDAIVPNRALENVIIGLQAWKAKIQKKIKFFEEEIEDYEDEIEEFKEKIAKLEASLKAQNTTITPALPTENQPVDPWADHPLNRIFADDDQGYNMKTGKFYIKAKSFSKQEIESYPYDILETKLDNLSSKQKTIIHQPIAFISFPFLTFSMDWQPITYKQYQATDTVYLRLKASQLTFYASGHT
eukprot:gene3030-3788_t